ncbi:hypothetical protein MPL3356_110093 [Mesorhizobium plurifarium]|uniref:Uncharacterized protein n=1 Tax=Mesorhizobium plurifarium TaxID=69974 RepID=A0A090D9M6_MESPL|nr:hypothetical protein MPL3356_110093 [Mesorhizobium plurifarium]
MTKASVVAHVGHDLQSVRRPLGAQPGFLTDDAGVVRTGRWEVGRRRPDLSWTISWAINPVALEIVRPRLEQRFCRS